MEPVQRLIIGNNVYDANDDELESEVTSYLNNLTKKQKTAKDGKAAIITATQNKTGKPITTNTYAEVIDKISKFEKKTFSVNDLMIRSIITSPMPTTATYNREIIGNIISRFTRYTSLNSVRTVANSIVLSRDMIHALTANNINYKLSIQVNLDFGSSGDKIPIISMLVGSYLFSFGKFGTSPTAMYFFDSYDNITKDVVDTSNLNFFAIEFEHKDTMPEVENFDIYVYGGRRVADKVSVSGYIPETKELLFSIPGNALSSLVSGMSNAEKKLDVQVGGCSEAIGARTIGQTALYLQDFGIRLHDDVQTSVVGNTNFLDMEVTS